MQTYIQCRRKAQFHRWQYIVGILGYSSQNHSPSCRNNHQEWPVQLYWILSHRQLFDSLGMQWKGSSQPWPCLESVIEWDWMLQILCYYLRRLKKSHMVPVLSRSREFSVFLDGTGTGTGKNWSRKKVPVPVPENLVPEKSTGYRHTLSWITSLFQQWFLNIQ